MIGLTNADRFELEHHSSGSELGHRVAYVIGSTPIRAENANSIGQREYSFLTTPDFLSGYLGERGVIVLCPDCASKKNLAVLARWQRDEDLFLPVVAVTEDRSVMNAMELVREGAIDVIVCSGATNDLHRSISDALQVEASLYPQQATRRTIKRRLDTLSRAESEVLKLLMRGNRNKEMALKLDVSVRTIEQRRRRLREKLKVGNDTELISLVVSSMIDPNPAIQSRMHIERLSGDCRQSAGPMAD